MPNEHKADNPEHRPGMKNIDCYQDATRFDSPSQPVDASDDSGRIKSRQRLRLQRTALAVVNYTVIGFYTLYLYFSGQLAIAPIAEVSLYLAVVFAYSFFFWLITSRRNLQFRDPSLTWPQLILAAGFAIFLFSISRTIFAQDLYFFSFLMSLLFAAFRLNLKQMLVTELPFFGIFAVLLLLHDTALHEAFGATVEHVAIYFALTSWMIIFATSISRLRNVLSARNKELKQALVQLNEIADKDDLTGAYNRRYLFQTLEREIERSKRSEGLLCVCLLDIDHFKEVNDTHGHQVGDEILREFIKRTRDSIRGNDELGSLADDHVLSRFGGEEFMLVLPLTDLDGATTCAERVLEAIRSHPFTSQRGPVKMSASSGIAQYNCTHDTIESLIGRADAALLQAKATGRDQVVIGDGASPAES